MKRNTAILTVSMCVLLLAGIPAWTTPTAWAEKDAPSQPTPPAAPSEKSLVEEALDLMGGAVEIVFVVRPLYKDGRYYAKVDIGKPLDRIVYNRYLWCQGFAVFQPGWAGYLASEAQTQDLTMEA